MEVRAMRTAVLRITQKEFAEILGYTEAVVRKWEKRGATITLVRQFAAAMDTVYERLDARQLARFEVALAEVGGSADRQFASVLTESFESPTTIANRMQRLSELDAEDGVLDVLSLAIDDIVDRYEVEGPLRLAPEAIAVRDRAEALLRELRHPAQSHRLYLIAGRLSGVLAYMAVNRGKFAHAKMYCREAFAIASLLNDRELQAWVRGTESFCAYYQGDFQDSVRLAREGIDLSSAGPQSIRLYSNGLARALGKLGDTHGVSEAIESAMAIASTHKTGPWLTPALTFAPYGEARLMANAATAYLSAGGYRRTLDYGHQVDQLVNESDSVWSRSLVKLDVAAALLHQRRPDVEQSVQLGVEALAASRDRPIRSVWQRAHELGAIMGPVPGKAPNDYLDSLREWAITARDFAAADDH
ncbi:hypothetical protein OG874_31620 [Nocardia sp. NBC_00565]|uniref:helix-turn-helix domain-containing protein n=1 Tax=Nocardia sp. NBC_00565 TaxID=2975993 RepID=UPI002E809565|nr:hypothetical protein [Nocardia sp. NBC_00565]WUC01324.1 hypothetical protein OG874_31620 [Nocardia sp. NBC_00565]